MKFMEINDDYILPVFIDEQFVLRELEQHDHIDNSKLTPYYQQLTEKMLSKGLLKKVKKNSKIVYVANQNQGAKHV